MQANQQKINYTVPFIAMVILMALIGFITSINQQFQAPLQEAYLQGAGALKNTFATLLTFAFFLAYLVMGPTAANTLQKRGYKGTLIVGLIVLFLGLGAFELSAIQFEKWPLDFQFGTITLPLSFFIFIAGSFITGAGLTFLQSSVNPYVVACDVKGTTGVQRQSIAGTGNSIMTTLGPLFVAYLIFKGATGSEIAVDSLFIPLALLLLFVLILTFSVNKLNLPDIQGTTVAADEKLEKSVWSFSHLRLGVLAIFVYVGVEVCVGANINLFATGDHGFDIKSAAKLASMYWLGMLIGRFVGSFISKVSAQTQLAFSSIVAGILVALAMLIRSPYVLIFVGLFHSIMWPAIFALAIDKLGKYTAKGTGALMMGIVGGAILPFAQGLLADALGSWHWTWLIVIVGEAYLLYYALIGYKVRQLPE